MRVRRNLGLTGVLEHSNILPQAAIKLGEVTSPAWATPEDRNLGVQLRLKWKGTVLLNAYLVAKGTTA